MKYFYASKISDNLSMTPEGFLICKSVPIARTGKYQYLKNEIGLVGEEVVDVYRTPENIFTQETISSFEGKAFTDDHPIEDVTVDNWQIYSKGELTNVRRGLGENEIYLIADIIVRDPITIDEILNKQKREVSAGYTCEYVEKDGKIYQMNLIGNHVALVKNGRAGKTVSIKDEKITKNFENKSRLNKMINKHNINKILKNI
jgi:hypothetical protein